MQDEIEAAAYDFARRVDRGEKVVIGVNQFADRESVPTEVFPIDETQQQQQVARVRRVKGERDAEAVRAALADVAVAARGSANLLYPMKLALARMATLGEVADTLRETFGTYQPS